MPKETGQKDNNYLLNATQTNKDLATLNPPKSGGELMCSGGLSICDTRRVTAKYTICDTDISHD